MEQVLEAGTVTLQRKRVAATSAVTRQLLADSKLTVSDTLGFATDQMILRLESLVTVDPRYTAEKEVEVVADPVFRDWHEHKVASYPKGSLRRWLWARWYGLDPKRDYGLRVRQGFKIERDALLPEFEHGLPNAGWMHLKARATSGPRWVEPA